MLLISTVIIARVIINLYFRIQTWTVTNMVDTFQENIKQKLQEDNSFAIKKKGTPTSTLKDGHMWLPLWQLIIIVNLNINKTDHSFYEQQTFQVRSNIECSGSWISSAVISKKNLSASWDGFAWSSYCDDDDIDGWWYDKLTDAFMKYWLLNNVHHDSTL